MPSVTQRIKQVKQPWGGYISIKSFNVYDLNDNKQLHVAENIHSSLVGMAVDYMTRFLIGSTVEDAFKISLIGANLIDEIENAKKLLSKITGLDDTSIINACKLVGYDVCYRAGKNFYRPVENIQPDAVTIENIRIMLNRSMLWVDQYGPIVLNGFDFEGAYTDKICIGDADYLTHNTLWDMKVSKNKPDKNNTLQLLVYYLMGMHSIYNEFQCIKQLGIFNPRLNCVYLLKISDISSDVIEQVLTDVIGY